MFVCYHHYQVSTNVQVNLSSGITIDVCMLSTLPGEYQLIFKSLQVNLSSGITMMLASRLPGEHQSSSQLMFSNHNNWCFYVITVTRWASISSQLTFSNHNNWCLYVIIITRWGPINLQIQVNLPSGITMMLASQLSTLLGEHQFSRQLMFRNHNWCITITRWEPINL